MQYNETIAQVFPVRVFVGGIVQKQFSQKEVPFDGEMDFHVFFVPPDRSKVDPGPGKWRARPAG